MLSDHSKLTLTPDNIDIYFPLKAKVDFVTRNLAVFNGTLYDVGCGRMPYKKIITTNPGLKQYIGIDIKNEYQTDSENTPDYYWDGLKLPLENETADTCMLFEVLEHVHEPQVVLSECNRVLRKNGTILITVPFLWTLHDVPYDENRYTPFCLQKHLLASGFEIVRMEASGGWHASMASMIALYVRRGIHNPKLIWLLSRLCMPVIKYLYNKDRQFDLTKFTEGQMITGLYCIARKTQ